LHRDQQPLLLTRQSIPDGELDEHNVRSAVRVRAHARTRARDDAALPRWRVHRSWLVVVNQH
jgi:hypothetical protein